MLLCSGDGPNSTFTPPAGQGWTLYSTDNLNFDGQTVAVFTNNALPSATSYDISSNAGGTSVYIWTFSGAASATPFTASKNVQDSTHASPVTVTATGLSTPANDCALLWLAGLDTGGGGITWTWPTGYTDGQQSYDNDFFSSGGAGGKTQAVAGPTGDVVGTVTGQSMAWVAYLIAVAPAGGGSTTYPIGVSESVTISDAASASALRVVSMSEFLSWSDALASLAARLAGLSEAVTLSESVVGGSAALNYYVDTSLYSPGARQQWAKGCPIGAVDPVTGDYVALTYRPSNNRTYLAVSTDKGVTWTYLLATDGESFGGGGFTSLAIDSAGGVHVVSEELQYCKIALTRSGGHVMGWTQGSLITPATGALNTNYCYNPTVLVVKNANGTECLAISCVHNLTSSGGNYDRAVIEITVTHNLTPTATANFFSLDGTAGSYTTIYTAIDATTDLNGYDASTMLAQMPGSKALVCWWGHNINEQYVGALYYCRYVLCSASGTNWTPETVTEIAHTTGARWVNVNNLVASSSEVFGLRTDGDNGLVIDKWASDGTFSKAFLSVPSSTPPIGLSGFLNVNASGTEFWCAYTRQDVSNPVGVQVYWGHYVNGSWITTLDTSGIATSNSYLPGYGGIAGVASGIATFATPDQARSWWVGSYYTIASSEFLVAASETVTMSASVGSVWSAVASAVESLSWTDSATANRSLLAGVSDSWTWTDSVAAGVALAAGLSESVTWSDTVGAVKAAVAQLSESVTLSDGLTAVASLLAGLAETVTVNEAIAATAVLVAAITESLSWSDGATALVTFVRSVSESVAWSDALAALANYVANVTESNAILEAVNAGSPGAYVAALAEMLTWSDGAEALAAFTLSVSDSVSWTEALAALGTYVASVTESTVLLDAVNAGNPSAYVAALAEMLSWTEGVAPQWAAIASLSESVTWSDAAQAMLVRLAALSESVEFFEAIGVVASYVANLGETVTLSELIQALQRSMVNVSEIIGWSELISAILSGFVPVFGRAKSNRIPMPRARIRRL